MVDNSGVSLNWSTNDDHPSVKTWSAKYQFGEFKISQVDGQRLATLIEIEPNGATVKYTWICYDLNAAFAAAHREVERRLYHLSPLLNAIRSGSENEKPNSETGGR